MSHPVGVMACEAGLSCDLGGDLGGDLGEPRLEGGTSHVLKAMGYSDDQANEAVRLSWCHLTPELPRRTFTSKPVRISQGDELGQMARILRSLCLLLLKFLPSPPPEGLA
jgi:hypothetical protein